MRYFVENCNENTNKQAYSVYELYARSMKFSRKDIGPILQTKKGEVRSLRPSLWGMDALGSYKITEPFIYSFIPYQRSSIAS